MRILIVKLSSLGDLFHALPVTRALKSGLGATVDWVTQPEYEKLVRCFDDVENVITFPRRSLLKNGGAFLKELRSRRYDYVFDLQGLIKSAAVTAAARGAKKIGPSASREGARIFYNAVAGKKNKERHAVDELFDAVRFLNLPAPPAIEFPVTFPSGEKLSVGLHIAICPASRAAGKNWPPARFAETAKVLHEEFGAIIHLVGGAGDRALCEEIAGGISGAQNHAGETSLIELGTLLQKMNLLITVDSGPMHMAAAIGTPVLALFGPTSPLRTGPYGNQHCVIESPLMPAEKIISKKTRHNDMRFIEAIQTDVVIRAAKQMIQGSGS